MSIDACLRGCYCEHLIDKPFRRFLVEKRSGSRLRVRWSMDQMLLLDESLSAIDIFTRRKIYQFLNNLFCRGSSHAL